jgi:hypothetical protein
MAAPERVTILAFQVGFGDCFLLRFHYAAGGDKHLLIDFGSYPKASWLKGDGMRRIADAIKAQCGGKLEGIVATHRHADHISGFTTEEDDPGSVIASCRPDVVVQPWTEDPDARRTARKPTAAFMSAPTTAAEPDRSRAFARGLEFVESLDALRDLLPIIDQEVAAFRGVGNADMAAQLAFYGGNGLGNRSAVENLMEMGRKGDARYVFHGADSGLEAVLPGVKVTVLGPPTLEQADTIRRYATTSDQYWLTVTRTALRLQAGSPPLFPEDHAVSHEDAPAYARWLVERLRSLRGRQLLEIVRSLDGVLNNTSVILLLEVGGRKLLFPGDAQLENWTYALEQPGVSASLRDVDFYKVGHHGSLNATPRTTLWNNFSRRTHGLGAAVSTLKGVHGGKDGNPTEVPRQPLMTALKDEATLVTTEELPQQPGSFAEIAIDV